MYSVAHVVVVAGLVLLPESAVTPHVTPVTVASSLGDEAPEDEDEADRSGTAIEAPGNAPHLNQPSPHHASAGGTTPEPHAAVPADWQQMTPGYHEPSVLPVQGKAMFYNEGVMRRVLENRLRAGAVVECAECVGYVAMLRAGDLNRRIWIQVDGGVIEGPFHVIDVADVKHVAMLLGKNWVVDVDHATALRWGMRGPKTVTLMNRPPDTARTRHADNLPAPGAPIMTLGIDLYRSARCGWVKASQDHPPEALAFYVR